jgi:hypothetical protein
MGFTRRFLISFLAVVLACGVGAVGFAGGHDDDEDEDECEVTEFDDIQFFFELNATDEDLGVQLKLGAEPWKKLMIKSPKGKKLLEVEGKGTLKEFGLTDFHFESNEPNFADMSMEDILETWPEGEYEFVARTIDGCVLKGTAELTHDIPAAPEITSPADGDEVDPDDLKIEWEPVTDPAGIQIVSYQVIVTNDDEPAFRFDVVLPPDATCVTVPSEFLEPGTLYELEVLAREESGNQTISLLFFTTAD